MYFHKVRLKYYSKTERPIQIKFIWLNHYIILVHDQMDSTTRLPIILTKGTGHFVTILIFDELDECPNSDKLSIASSVIDNLDDKNPCQYSGFKSKKASKKLLVPFRSSFKSVSIPNV